jgi:hypothetical protein
MKRRILQILLTCCLLVSASSSRIQAQTLVQSYTLTIEIPAKRIAPIKVMMPKIERLFTTTRYFPGKLYAFNRSFGDMVSALNVLAHRAYFWDSDGVERPLFEIARFTPVKNDHVFGAYAVSTTPNAQELVWRVSSYYNGIAPRILSHLDGTRLSLSVSYSNEIQPSDNRSIRDQFKALEAALKSKIGQKPVGVSIISVNDPTLTLGINDSLLMPVASAWKSIGLMYFLEYTDPAVWRNVPIRYWKTIYVEDVPAQYQAAWLQYHPLLDQIYRAIIFSGNEEAAEMLAYVYNTRFATNSASNPIITFNDWWLQKVNPQSKSGLFSWDYGALQQPGLNDPRFYGRKMLLNGKSLPISNLYTPRDLANAYFYLLTAGRALGYYDVALELLSIRSPIISKIESHLITTQEQSIRTAGKDGYFFADSSNKLGHGANNDAGLITLPDGRQFIVSFMALDPDLIDVDVVAMALRGIINSQPN